MSKAAIAGRATPKNHDRARAGVMKKAEPIVRSAVDRLESLDLAEDDIHRLMENELAIRRTAKETGKRRA